MIAVTAFPEWQPHIEVWILTAGIAALGIYVARVIQPKAVEAGHPPITGRQKFMFWTGLLVFWVASDWPIHDISEERLYWVHMVQHALITLVLPPLMLMSVPTWLSKLVLGEGALKRFVYFWGRPIRAVIVYNLLIALSHWALIVNNSITYSWLHYGIHTLVVGSAFLVWMSICGPEPELRAPPPLQMVTLFLMSVIPTIPAAFLTAAEGVIYTGYDHAVRLWGFDVVDDQQVAGVVMKVISGFYLWGIIGFIFFRWAFSQRGEKSKYRGKLVRSDGTVVDSSTAEDGANEADGVTDADAAEIPSATPASSVH
jgi:putative membrane protein